MKKLFITMALLMILGAGGLPGAHGVDGRTFGEVTVGFAQSGNLVGHILGALGR